MPSSRLTADQDLASKLSEELKFEKAENFDTAFIKNFTENNSFKIEDKPDSNTVTLTRTFGNERIRVTFDITNPDFEGDPDDYAEKPENDEEEPQQSSDEAAIRFIKLPYRCSVTIEKDNKGVLAFDLVLEEGTAILEHVAYFADASLIDGTSSESEWKRRSLYSGPTYETLDDDIQRLFEEYLKERGINESLAIFVPTYAEYKEQQEYVKWMENVHKFITG
ncbi:8908_t:CDS:2 [Paraglomus occultum]|uniref:8908_t:CDS:1 n=1 Tax=Paraglomus occultum TaxID=144539 RepID=A0A9N9GC88_9GLOM|nr:8908_t:CDS:2 [Paraglomus occultum]